MMIDLLKGNYLAAIYEVLCIAYAKVLRDLIVELVNDPDSQVDEILLGILDKVFNYEG